MTEQNKPNPSVPVEQTYTPEELNAAAAEIANLTPEKWLERTRYLKQLEESNELPEAGGIAFTRLYGQNGGEINITARAKTPTKAVIDLLDSVRYVMLWQSHMDWKPSKGVQTQAEKPPQQPAVQFMGGNVTTSIPAQPQMQQPSYIPDQQVAGTLDFPAEQLVATISEGKTFWKVKGGKFAKWGVTVWPEVLMAAGIDVSQINPQMPFPLVGMTAHYTVKGDGNPAKVVSLTR